jgi:hypothetical protein
MKTILFSFIISFGLSLHAFGQKQVTHLVLFKLKQGISKDDLRFKEAIKMAKSLPVRIKEIEDCSMGVNFSTRPIAYDFGLTVIFSSRKDLNSYLAHPFHIQLVEVWKEIAEWNIVDYEELEE